MTLLEQVLAEDFGILAPIAPHNGGFASSFLIPSVDAFFPSRSSQLEFPRVSLLVLRTSFSFFFLGNFFAGQSPARSFVLLIFQRSYPLP